MASDLVMPGVWSRIFSQSCTLVHPTVDKKQTQLYDESLHILLSAVSAGVGAAP